MTAHGCTMHAPPPIVGPFAFPQQALAFTPSCTSLYFRLPANALTLSPAQRARRGSSAVAAPGVRCTSCTARPKPFSVTAPPDPVLPLHVLRCRSPKADMRTPPPSFTSRGGELAISCGTLIASERRMAMQHHKPEHCLLYTALAPVHCIGSCTSCTRNYRHRSQRVNDRTGVRLHLLPSFLYRLHLHPS